MTISVAMKPLLRIVMFAACLVSCGNSATSAGGAGPEATPLIDESSGWKRVATIEDTGTRCDTAQGCVDTVYDLTVSAEAAQVLFSADKLEPDGPMRTYFKASRSLAGAANAPATTLAGLPNLPNHPNLSFRPFFRPGSFDMEVLAFWHGFSDTFTHLELYDEAAQLLTAQSPSYDASTSTKVLDNGDILAGDVTGASIGELDYYQRRTNSWTYLNQSAGDGQWLIAYTPFRLDDGSVLAFRLYSLDDRAYLSVADFVPGAAFPAAPYKARFSEEHAEYAPTGKNGVTPTYAQTVRISAYTTAGNSLTVVLEEQDPTTQAYSLSAYLWTEGDSAFQKLYGAVPVSALLGRKLSDRNAAACASDGSAFAIVQDAHVGFDDHLFHLGVVNAHGEASYGTVSDNSGGDTVVTLSTPRYANGAYYAVASPFFKGQAYLGQHVDVVKLTP